MYKQILDHKAYVTKQLAGTLSEAQRKELLAYHTTRLRDFQHERLIHLLVTFFFAFLFLGSLIALFVPPPPQTFWPLALLTSILFVLELAYIRHYYLLENSVQSLYLATKQLGKNKP